VRAQLRDLSVPVWREYAAHARAGLVPFAPVDGGRWTGPAVDLEEARRTPAPAPFVDGLDEVPVLLVVTVELDQLAVLDVDADRQSIVGGASIYPFVQNILLAARDAGLAGVMTTFLTRAERDARAVLDLPVGVAIAAVVALGHPERHVTRLRRRAVEEFARIDRYSGEPFTG
jgi:hypothetical protein